VKHLSKKQTQNQQHLHVLYPENLFVNLFFKKIKKGYGSVFTAIYTEAG